MRLSRLEKLCLALIIAIGVMFAVGANRAGYKGPAFIPAPEQIMLSGLDNIVLSTKSGDIVLELVATYNISAGVRGRKNYRGDALSSVSPMDLVLAWGDLNQPLML